MRAPPWMRFGMRSGWAYRFASALPRHGRRFFTTGIFCGLLIHSYTRTARLSSCRKAILNLERHLSLLNSGRLTTLLSPRFAVPESSSEFDYVDSTKLLIKN